MESDNLLTSCETVSKFLDLSEPVPHLKNGNDTASIPRAALCRNETTQTKCLAQSACQWVNGITVFVPEHKDLALETEGQAVWSRTGSFASTSPTVRWSLSGTRRGADISAAGVPHSSFHFSGLHLDATHLRL